MKFLLRRAAILIVVPAIAPAQAQRLPAQELQSWTLSSAPTVRIGEEGGADTEFGRVVATTRLPSGEVVVADGRTQRLSLFSADGAFIRNMSRRGQGPGELENLRSVFRARDTLFVLELSPGASRMNIFAVPRGFRTRMLLRADNAPRGLAPSARLANGDLLVSAGTYRVVEPTAGAVARDSMTLGVLRIGEPGEVTWIGMFPNNTWIGYRLESAPGGVALTRYPLGPSLVTGASANQIWVGDSEGDVITIFDASGRRVSRATVPIRPRAFSDQALERAKARALELASDAGQRSRYEAIYSESLRPRTAPLFTRFVPGVEGEMAVELFREEPDTEASFIVFDRAGKAVASLDVPRSVAVHEIGRDYILGVHTDDYGVEQVVQYRLTR